MYGVIYLITNLLNDKKYVGQTTQPLSERIKQHKYGRQLVDKAIREVGFENFQVDTLEVCENQEQLNEREKFWIDELDCLQPQGYNCLKNGQHVKAQVNKPQAEVDEPYFKLIHKNLIFRHIGAKIAYYRTLRQMSQRELATKVNLSTSTIGRIERGKYNSGVPISTLLDIAEGLRIELSSLVTFSEEEKKVWWEIDKNML